MSDRYYSFSPQDPVRDVLRTVTGQEPPSFVRGYSFKGLTDMQLQELQDWACTAVKPEFLTGIGLLDAAEKQVEEAVINGNIPREGTQPKTSEVPRGRRRVICTLTIPELQRVVLELYGQLRQRKLTGEAFILEMRRALMDVGIDASPPVRKKKTLPALKAVLQFAIDGPVMAARIRAAFRKWKVGRHSHRNSTVRHGPAHFTSAFEHGQWWVQCSCGASWGAHAAVGGDAVDNFTFERVSQGETEDV